MMKKFGGLMKLNMLLIGMAVILLLAACGGDETGSAAESEEEEVSDSASDSTESEEIQELESVKIVLNWFANAGHGGIYAADDQGYFAEKNLDVTIEPGGPQVSSIQMVSSGSAEFGLAHGDQIVIARNQGIELVALAAINQRSPQAFMFHKGHGIDDFDEINGRKAFIQPGIAYWEYFKSKYDLSDVNEVAFTGDHTNFIQDVDSVNQVYLTGEPFFMEQQGVETEVKLISDSGYDPYQYVLYVTKDYLEENEETVRNFVTAFSEGWEYFKETPTGTLELIHEHNPDQSMESLNYANETFEEFIYGGDAAEHGVGYMTEERWSTLINQLDEAGVMEVEVEATDIFTTEYLPEK
ncbi:ABC transporter substrate-binding protein [Aquibacillus albus]|uniref:NitT/TauT family transport system substrate-binding protein n=1 Tax=Aquibacillus albus TaxID=1168171 RepID=A0ABS2MVX8_9BACI|nr:ABC transporter substrate-binding protein [Aquibacillus albus]MBM7570054.1 NitT/TauT family transport system substrate-binding protein [Aquibacillus albus]